MSPFIENGIEKGQNQGNQQVARNQDYGDLVRILIVFQYLRLLCSDAATH